MKSEDTHAIRSEGTAEKLNRTVMEKSSKRNRKPSKGTDRISQLPDDILHYILSFVPMIDVVRLSILSRRWKSLWVTMPYLNFDVDESSWQKICYSLLIKKGIYLSFEEFISWVLMSQGSTNLTRFRLNCSTRFDEVKFTRWVQIAISRNVQELVLEAKETDKLKSFQIPSSNFTCESLRALSLKLPWCVLQFPEYLKFKQLKSLYLKKVELIDDDLTRKLFSECSVLEDLSLIGCVVRSMKILDISSSSLKYLKVSNNNKYVSNGYRTGFWNCELRISCPNLLSFICLGGAAKNYHLENVSSLEDLHIELHDGKGQNRDKEIAQLMWKVLEQVENIKVLKVDMTYLCYAVDELRSFSTIFCRLKFLTLSLELCESYIFTMLYLFNHFPDLESLTIDSKELDTKKKQNKNGQFHVKGSASAYTVNNLKCVKLINYKGKRIEVRLVKAMLKIGVALEKFIIIYSENWNPDLNMEETILKFPKASTFVKVKFF